MRALLLVGLCFTSVACTESPGADADGTQGALDGGPGGGGSAGRDGGAGGAVPDGAFATSGGAAGAPSGGSGGATPGSGGGASQGGGGGVLDAGADATPAADGAALPDAASACTPVERAHPIEGAAHVADCSVLAPGSNPPASGPHYGTWAAFRTYTSAIARGFWIHSMEHGAVVITYNCPGGCASDVQAIEDMIAALPGEPLCLQTSQSVRSRVILTPDPKLDVAFAASAWGFTLRSNCFDAAAFRAFVLSHLGNAPENFCADGVDVSVGYPEGCGG